MKKRPVTVQKGKMIANPLTQGMATYGQMVKESNKNTSVRRSGMKNHLKQPKK